MRPEILAGILEEIADLEAALAHDERFMRLQALKNVLSLYLPDTPIVSSAETLPVHKEEATSKAKVVNRKPSPERIKIVEASRLYLLNRTGPVPTREILSHLNGIGITVPGNPPLNNLSAMLSKYGHFIAHGRSGWTLPEEPDPALQYESGRERQLEEDHERELGSDSPAPSTE